jgi:hypothetical protein
MDRDYNPEKRCPVPSDFKCLINAQTGEVESRPTLREVKGGVPS